MTTTRFVLNADFDATLNSVGVDGLRNAVRAGLSNANVPNSNMLSIEFERGSIIVVLSGPASATSGVNSAVSSGGLFVVVNNQTLMAQPSSDPQDNASSNSLSGGAVAGIIVAVLLVLALVLVVVLQKRVSERGTYEVDEAANANDIITEVDMDAYVPTIGTALWESEVPKITLYDSYPPPVNSTSV